MLNGPAGTDLLRAVSLLNMPPFAGCAGFRSKLWLAADESAATAAFSTGMVPDLLSPSAPLVAAGAAGPARSSPVAAGAGDRSLAPTA